MTLIQVGFGVPTLSIKGCVFDNISTQSSIIEDVSYRCNVFISDVSVRITSGMLYTSHHTLGSLLEISSVFLSSKQLHNSSEYGLFYFEERDDVTMNNLTVNYTYDGMDECQDFGVIWNNDIGVNCQRFVCSNPVILITNLGEVWHSKPVHLIINIKPVPCHRSK